MFVKSLLMMYKGDDWMDYINVSSNYYIEKVVSSDLFDIYILTIKSGEFIPLSRHSKIECWFKILIGTLTEVIYYVKGKTAYTKVLKTERVSYINNETCCYGLYNKGDNIAVVIHVCSKIII